MERAQLAMLVIPDFGSHNAAIHCIVGVPHFYSQTEWYNTALVISSAGERIYRQAKLCPCCEQDGTAGEWMGTFELEGVTCVGGHVVGLSLAGHATITLQSIPASISKLKHLRSIYYIARQDAGDAAVIMRGGPS